MAEPLIFIGTHPIKDGKLEGVPAGGACWSAWSPARALLRSPRW